MSHNYPDNAPLIGFGAVMHRRLWPRVHAFRYKVFFLMLPMRSLALRGTGCSRWWLAINRAGLMSYHDADHGDDNHKGLKWIEALLHSEGIHDADGEIWLQCFPRVLGYAFKPVSFWFCHKLDSSLRCVVAEVNNTFGQRHAYLLDQSRPLIWGEPLQASKQFYVSPFFEVQGNYQFRFLRTSTSGQDRWVARIDYDAPTPGSTSPIAQLQTSISGTLKPASFFNALKALASHPLMTLSIIARIHWQALRLWLKRVPLQAQPASVSASKALK